MVIPKIPVKMHRFLQKDTDLAEPGGDFSYNRFLETEDNRGGTGALWEEHRTFDGDHSPEIPFHPPFNMDCDSGRDRIRSLDNKGKNRQHLNSLTLHLHRRHRGIHFPKHIIPIFRHPLVIQ